MIVKLRVARKTVYVVIGHGRRYEFEKLDEAKRKARELAAKQKRG